MASSKPSTNYGGFDYKFVKNVSAYTCQICCKVYRDPHLTGCCGQRYCESCLDKSVRAFVKERCPHCRAEGKEFNHIRDLDLKRKISSLDIHCTRWSSGCSWVGQFQSLSQHDKMCGYELICCPRSCNLTETFMRKDLDVHLTTNCPFRKATCKHCGKEGTYRWMNENHYFQCEKMTVPCPNGCGQSITQTDRSAFDKHNEVCTHAVIECPFAKVGCIQNPIRSKMDKHQNDAVQHHLLLTMLSLQSEKEINESERKRNQVMVEKMRAVSSHIDSLLLLCPSEQQQPLRSIRSVLDEELYSLRTASDEVYLRMEAYSNYSTKQWLSPPFYVHLNPKEDYGYKMCIGVLTTGDVSLYLLKGEYDHLLIWPIRHSLKISRWRGIQVSLINLQLKKKMQQSRTSIAGRLLNLSCFSKEPILECERVSDSGGKSQHLIETIHICDDLSNNSADDAVELSLCFRFA